MTERQGVEIDYCPQCRGVWLDRGELDKLIERSAAPPPQTPSPPRPRPTARTRTLSIPISATAVTATRSASPGWAIFLT